MGRRLARPGLRVATLEECAQYGGTLPGALIAPIAGASGPTVSGSAIGGTESASNVSSVATAQTMNVAAGDTVLVFIRDSHGSSVTSVTDNGSNTYAEILGATGGSNVFITAYIAVNVAANSALTVTAHYGSTSQDTTIHAIDIAGLGSSPTTDVADSHTGTSTSLSSNAYSTTSTSEIVCFLQSTFGGDALSSLKVGGVAATLETFRSGNSLSNTTAGWVIESATQSSITTTGTSASSNPWCVSTVGLAVTSGSPAGSTPAVPRLMSMGVGS